MQEPGKIFIFKILQTGNLVILDGFPKLLPIDLFAESVLLPSGIIDPFWISG